MYSSSLELYIASGGSGIDMGEGDRARGASADRSSSIDIGEGDRAREASAGRGSGGSGSGGDGESSGGETNIESRKSIAINWPRSL